MSRWQIDSIMSIVICVTTCDTIFHVRQEVNWNLAQVIVRENESLESALKRFKRSCARDGVMSELRKREHYEKPSVRRKKKSEAARKKARKY